MKILVADDDPIIRQVLVEILGKLGHETAEAATAAETLRAAQAESFDLVLLDLNFPDCTDLSTLGKLRSTVPDTDVIMVTAQVEDLDIVAHATELGSFDYVPKPIREDDIRIRVTRVMQMRQLTRTARRIAAELANGNEIQDIIGETPAIKNIVREAQNLAAYDVPVLIGGETGTGKELVARALHYGGPRRERPFVTLNCAALASGLTESELFGHEKGAFTGAHQTRQGAFEEAEDGTLFLDEIGDMSPQAQASLLHVLEHGEYRSVGGKPKKTKARVVMASNQDLEALITDNKFRRDLFYRVTRMRLHLPPLRQRRDDIPLLAKHFLAIIEAKIGKGVKTITKEAMQALQGYHWPGNVRELRNEIERAYLRADGKNLNDIDLTSEVMLPSQARGEDTMPAPETIEEIHKLVGALRSSGGNISRAAEIMGIHRNTMSRWMQRYGLCRH